MCKALRLSWLAAFILLASASGCSAAQPTAPQILTEKITLAANKELLYETYGEYRVTYREGQTVNVTWQEGVVRINGDVHKPHPPAPPIALDFLRSEYGRVPLILAWVNSHNGDETQVWNEAFNRWESAKRELIRAVQAQYRADYTRLGADGAARNALSTLRKSALVAAVRRETFAQTPDSSVWIVWAGLSTEASIDLSLDEPPPAPQPQAPVSREGFAFFLATLHMLDEKNDRRVRIELSHGNITVMSGDVAVQASQARGER